MSLLLFCYEFVSPPLSLFLSLLSHSLFSLSSILPPLSLSPLSSLLSPLSSPLSPFLPSSHQQMSVTSLTPSPLTHYSSGPILPSDGGDTTNYSPLNSHHLLQDIDDSSTSIPRTSSPIVHSELVSDYNGSDSSSYLGTPYLSLPITRAPVRSMLQEEEDMVTPNSSPLMLRPSSGRLMGG